MTIRYRGFFLILLLSLGCFACSRSAPEISYGTIRLVYYQSPEGNSERFSFFILPEDEDGLEDIDELYLYHDREGLSWRLGADDWISFEFEGKTWIGTHSIAMLDNESLPRGQFRAVLIDKGGEQSERNFTFDAPADSRYPFPFLTLKNDRYLIESTYPAHFLICYDAEGTYLSAKAVTVLDGAVAELELPQGTRAVALWAEDPEYLTSALTDVIPLR